MAVVFFAGADAADSILATIDFKAVRPVLEALLTNRRIPEFLLLERIKALVG